MARITTTLPPDALAALDEVARARGRSRGDLVREAVYRTWLNDRNDSGPVPHPPAPDQRAAARKRFGQLLSDLRASADPQADEDELGSFVQEEIEAYRREKRARLRSARDG